MIKKILIIDPNMVSYTNDYLIVCTEDNYCKGKTICTCVTDKGETFMVSFPGTAYMGQRLYVKHKGLSKNGRPKFPLGIKLVKKNEMGYLYCPISKLHDRIKWGFCVSYPTTQKRASKINRIRMDMLNHITREHTTYNSFSELCKSYSIIRIEDVKNWIQEQGLELLINEFFGATMTAPE